MSPITRGFFGRRRDAEYGDRLPPGQYTVRNFPVLSAGPTPHTPLDEWTFEITGEVDEVRRWTWEEFRALPSETMTVDIHCVTRWSKFDTVWEGVSVKTLVENGLIKIKSSATHVMQHAEYGFTVNLPLEVVLQDNFLLATHFNGEPISPDHGYPLRGVVGYIPGQKNLETPYFWKGAKWLRALEFMPRDRRGFWEQAGYHNRADVWREERFG